MLTIVGVMSHRSVLWLAVRAGAVVGRSVLLLADRQTVRRAAPNCFAEWQTVSTAWDCFSDRHTVCRVERGCPFGAAWPTGRRLVGGVTMVK